MANIDVSIVMLSYYHEGYLARAIDSILEQDTSLSYEIIVGDDCSGDQTPEIIRAYAKKYPSVIKPVLRDKNIGATANLYDVISRSAGTYIAILEGDDYWIDQKKLQKQVEFLKENPTFSACYARCLVVDAGGTPLEQQPKIGTEALTYTLDNLARLQLPGQTGTAVFRNGFDAARWDVLKKADPLIGDRTLAFILLGYGEIRVLPEELSAYRLVTHADAKSYSAQKQKNECGRLFHIYDTLSHYAKHYDKKAVKFTKKAKYRLLAAALKHAAGTKDKKDRAIACTCLKKTNPFGFAFFLLARPFVK